MSDKLIQRIRSIEKLLGIEFDPSISKDINESHRHKIDGRLDKLEKATKIKGTIK